MHPDQAGPCTRFTGLEPDLGSQSRLPKVGPRGSVLSSVHLFLRDQIVLQPSPQLTLIRCLVHVLLVLGK